MIKLRAWTGKKMIYQDKQYLASFIRRVVPEIIVDHGGEAFSQHEGYLPNGGVIDEYLTQFTGLTDKNDKEIYEGDILKVSYEATKFENFWLVEPIGSLERDGQYYGLCVSLNGNGNNYFIDQSILAGEVVGNIYEQPELLKSK